MNKVYTVELTRTLKLSRTLVITGRDAEDVKARALELCDELGDLDADTEASSWRVKSAHRGAEAR